MQPFGHNTWANIGRVMCPVLGGAGFPSRLYYSVAWADVYPRTKWHLNPSSRLVTTDMNRCAPFGEGDLGPHLTQCGRGRGLPPCQVSSWSIKPFGHNTPTSWDKQTENASDSTGRTILQTVAQKHWMKHMSSK